MKRFLVGAVLLAQVLGSGAASAQYKEDGAPDYINAVTFQNVTQSPVWVTFYESSSLTDTWHIVTGAGRPTCVLPQGKWIATGLHVPQIRVRTESKKGHGDCSTGTYNDMHIDQTVNSSSAFKKVGGMGEAYGEYASLSVDSRGASHLVWVNYLSPP